MTADQAAPNDGGPAFPVSTGDPHKEYQDGPYTAQFPGMRLRDYFAAEALAGMLASFAELKSVEAQKTSGLSTAQARAVVAYEHADAMLRARSA